MGPRCWSTTDGFEMFGQTVALDQAHSHPSLGEKRGTFRETLCQNVVQRHNILTYSVFGHEWYLLTLLQPGRMEDQTDVTFQF